MEEIPAGRVASYGQIARLIGLPAHSRLVGRVLSQAELYGDYPCHRVVSHSGALAASFATQRELLETEGVEFRGERARMKSTAGSGDRIALKTSNLKAASSYSRSDLKYGISIFRCKGSEI